MFAEHLTERDHRALLKTAFRPELFGNVEELFPGPTPKQTREELRALSDEVFASLDREYPMTRRR